MQSSLWNIGAWRKADDILAERKVRKEGRGRDDDKGIERENKKRKENDVQRPDKTIKPPVSPAYSMGHGGKTHPQIQKQKKVDLLTEDNQHEHKAWE